MQADIDQEYRPGRIGQRNKLLTKTHRHTWYNNSTANNTITCVPILYNTQGQINQTANLGILMFQPKLLGNFLPL